MECEAGLRMPLKQENEKMIPVKEDRKSRQKPTLGMCKILSISDP